MFIQLKYPVFTQANHAIGHLKLITVLLFFLFPTLNPYMLASFEYIENSITDRWTANQLVDNAQKMTLPLIQ